MPTVVFTMHVAEIILIVIFGFIGLWGAIYHFCDYLQRRNCAHLAYRENAACNAICTRCGKNLGFVAIVRRDKTKREVSL